MRHRDEAVLFIHSTGTGPSLWANVPDAAIGGRRKILPAHLGYPPKALVPRGRQLRASVDDAAEVLKEVPDAGRVHVVAHSYGALVALHVLPKIEERVASVFFYEPVVFCLMRNRPTLDPEAAKELLAFSEDRSFIDDDVGGGREAWQETFIDYWNRPGSWARMPEPLRAASLAVGWKMYQEVRSCFLDEEPEGGFRLTAPVVTIARGERTTASAVAMATSLVAGRPNASLVVVPGAAHMAPLTHPTKVYDELARHMARATE